MGRQLFVLTTITTIIALFIGFMRAFTGSAEAMIVLIGVLGLVPVVLITTSIDRNQKLLWPLLIVSSISAAGLMLQGYTVLDEFYLACIILGSLVSTKAKKTDGEQKFGTDRMHRFVFLLLIAYMLVQCFYGMFVLESPRKLRWVVYFLMLGAITLILTDKKTVVPSVRNLALLITVTALIYLCVYIGYGIFFELLGINRFDLQYAQIMKGVDVGAIAIWGTTAYALFPVAVAMPAIFILLKDKASKFRRIAWITLTVAAFGAFYYDSRVGVLTILAFIILSIVSLGLRKAIVILSISVIILSLFIGLLWEGERKTAGFIIDDHFRFIDTLLLQGPKRNPTEQRDLGRILLIEVAFTSIADSWEHFLFGYGYRRGGFVIAPHLDNLFLYHGIRHTVLDDGVGAEAFTNVVVETGMVGLSLLALNFFFVARQILRQKSNPNRLALLLSLLVIAGWLFVIDILDIVLFYLAIMPSGVLVQLSRNESYQFSKIFHVQRYVNKA